MRNFDYSAPTRLIFGKGAEKKVGETLAPLAKKILLHYGGQSIKKSGLYDRVTQSLKDAGIAYIELGGVQPNPRLSLVREGIALCRKEGVELILAVGGGSVIDSAKAIGVGVYWEGDIWEVYENYITADKMLPVATILTIPAAGSETSNGSVITNEEKQMKIGFGAEVFRPVVSFMNPELFFTIPKNQIANGVSDMMSHVFERYFTNEKRTDLTDALCEGTLRAIMKNAAILMEDPENYDAWAEIGFAGSVAHVGLLGMGREEDWASHGIEHELSALYDVAHGAGLAVITPSWMRYVCRENIPMFQQFAENVMGVQGLRDPEAAIEEAIQRLQAFYRRMALPTTLTELGIKPEDYEPMSKKATAVAYGRPEAPLGMLKKLYWQDILEIYKSAT